MKKELETRRRKATKQRNNNNCHSRNNDDDDEYYRSGEENHDDDGVRSVGIIASNNNNNNNNNEWQPLLPLTKKPSTVTTTKENILYQQPQQQQPHQQMQTSSTSYNNEEEEEGEGSLLSSQQQQQQQHEHPPSCPYIIYLISCCAAINTTNVGFDIGVNSPASILIKTDLNWEDWQLELFMGCLNLFAIFGALSSSRIVKLYGMKIAFLLSSTLFVIGIMLMVLTTTTTTPPVDDDNDDDKYYKIMMIIQLFMGRIIVGLGVGFGFAITPQYISEISPKQYRGYFVSWSEIGCNIGILLGFATGFLFSNIKSPGKAWRLMFSMGCLLPILMILLVLMGILVESPRWLVTQNRYKESLQVLSKLNNNKNKNNNIHNHLSNSNSPSSPSSTAVEDKPIITTTDTTPTTNTTDTTDYYDPAIIEILEDIQNDIEQEKQQQQQQQQQRQCNVNGSSSSSSSSLMWLLKEKKSTTVNKMLQLAFGIAISHEICGIDAIQYYLVFIMDASGITSQQKQALYLVALGALKLLCLFIAMNLIDKLGRRPLLMISVGGMILSLLMIAIMFSMSTTSNDEDDDDILHSNTASSLTTTNSTTDSNSIHNIIEMSDETTTITHYSTTTTQQENNTTITIRIIGCGLALYLAFFSIGLGPLGWVLPPELTSTTLRTKVVGLTTFANRMTATIMTSTMLSLANLLGWGGYFCLLTIINITIWVLAYMYLPETKGKKLEDTNQYYH